MITKKSQLEHLDDRRPIIGASLCDDLSDNIYNSQSEPTEFVPNYQDTNLFFEQDKSKSVVNTRKLAFVKNLSKPALIPPPEL